MREIAKIFLLIIGPSGSGKTAIADKICTENGLKQVWSYTNRPQRRENETGHIFLKEPDIEKIKKKYPSRVAETVFDSFYYFADAAQVESSDIYVISPDAVPQFMENYKGKKKVKVVYVTVPEWVRRNRMLRRGDSEEKTEQRIVHDRSAFSAEAVKCDLEIRNFVLGDSVDRICEAVKEWEKEKRVKSEKSKSKG